jgi:hypothetical protein
MEGYTSPTLIRNSRKDSTERCRVLAFSPKIQVTAAGGAAYTDTGFYAICFPSSPPRSARKARTSVTYCKPSNNGTKCRRSLSVGSLIQPSIGIALSGSG